MSDFGIKVVDYSHIYFKNAGLLVFISFIYLQKTLLLKLSIKLYRDITKLKHRYINGKWICHTSNDRFTLYKSILEDYFEQVTKFLIEYKYYPQEVIEL